MRASILDELEKNFLLQDEYLGNDKPINRIAPLVSVTVVTYQHANYIRECLDGILSQQTDISYEIIIGEDGSTDGTREICMEYAKKDPDKIRLFLRNRNHSHYISENKSVMFNSPWTFMSARGKYIAICEGDDYWIDPCKLEKQLAFMTQYPNLSMSFHGARIKFADSNKPSKIFRYYDRRFFSAKEVILGGGAFYPTCSALFRRDVIENLPDWYITSPVGDILLPLLAIGKGDVGYIDEVMAVYNSGVSGSWTQRMRKKDFRQRLDYLLTLETIRNAFNQYSGFRYTAFLRKKNSLNFRDILTETSFDKQQRKRIYEDLKDRMFPEDKLMVQLHYLLDSLLFLGYGLKLFRVIRRASDFVSMHR
ncbi:MAG: glycosyltransferase [Deltaproteobacteria bacterium]|nr:glycosyltransferase [Deltaproteobacteria bacterium]